MNRIKDVAARVLPGLLFAVAVLGAWQAYVSLSGISPSTLPGPGDVVSALEAERSALADDALVTVQEIAVGYLVAIVVALVLAGVIHASRMVERAVYPWLVISQMVPVPAIAPIIVVWTGFGLLPKVIVIALVCFFPIAVNAIDGLRATERELVDLLRTLGASRWQRFRIAQLPAALPFLFSGLKVGAAISVIGAVFAEWVGASSGLGYAILQYNNQNATAEMFATIVVLAGIGISLFAMVAFSGRLLMPWHHAARAIASDPLATKAGKARERREVRAV